jgi:hypothetical protein
LLKQRNIFENTQHPFKSEDTVKQSWSDERLIDQAKEERERAQLRAFVQNQMLEGGGGGVQDIAERMSLAESQKDHKESVRGQKKRELRDQDKII